MWLNCNAAKKPLVSGNPNPEGTIEPFYFGLETNDKALILQDAGPGVQIVELADFPLVATSFDIS